LSIFILGAVAAVGLGPFTGRFDGWEPVLRGGLPAAVILGACVLARPGAGAVRPAAAFAPAALAASVAAALGDASYSLYLCHPFVIRLCRNLWLAVVKDRLPVGGFLLLALGLAMAAGLVLHRLIERPMTRWLQMRWRLRRLVTAPSSHLSS
jgi:peptidoglycan/LPS O-acetylase OafA/YrhL